mmetsp:Transcript_10029/g.17476  ORF Transcript_10029/g.17476 Transcript_10029/m.17476 type:complete len:114 (-) Transcript_10029:468-809(-)|eukprot:CAMPEP_0196657240 /NCGR_PEP_ID=MMETSP1086-20130531/22525_1 /TAXON_ID=77921 /ORGANISM="Cyanoptyche  gloeocystis , Strain SAG4.97" /LENGTH=113 /DNA_ID=CAMNT_0041990293 /DNA_START=55 /DNA_END=396 /DNA_ORIENTATION=+
MSWKAALSNHIRELRVHFCPVAVSSEGARSFVQKNYSNLKALNPNLPILIRDVDDIDHPRLAARYDYGEESEVNISNLDDRQIMKVLETLLRTGETMPRTEDIGSGPRTDDII